VTWSGHFRTPLSDVRVEPRPLQKPHPKISVGGGLSTVSCDVAAALGLPLCLPSLFYFPEDYVAIVERYPRADERRELGGSPVGRLSELRPRRAHEPGGARTLGVRTSRATPVSRCTIAAATDAGWTTTAS